MPLFANSDTLLGIAELHDASALRPFRRAEPLDACGGRGLVIVDAPADEWGVTDRGGVGKLVWASWRSPGVG